MCPYIINLLVFVDFSKIILSVFNKDLERQIRSGFVINLEDKRQIRILIKYPTSPCRQSLPPRRWFSFASTGFISSHHYVPVVTDELFR